MVAVIHTPSSLRTALNYNEQKIKQQKALCLLAYNYPKDAEALNYYQKFNRLAKQAALNQNVKKNAVHISLNFDPSEKLSNEVLEKLAIIYMEKIGFGKQPFLVYEHRDAAHPHIHIVTTNIQSDGKRIELHNIGRNQSEKARREIEEEFNLVKACSKRQTQETKIKPAQKLHYGKSETKRAITNVLDTVINFYKYASLAELNAVLNLYNVRAERGCEGSRTFQKNGLVYHARDEKGNSIGVPIKASLIYSKPTLTNLEKKFVENEIIKKQHKKNITNRIEWALVKRQNGSLHQLIKELEKDRIHTVLRQNAAGFIYGITFIDHSNKTIFNGSDLGKQYSAKAITERCEISHDLASPQIHESKPIIIREDNERKEYPEKNKDVVGELLAVEKEFCYVPFQFKKPKGGKRKRLTR